MRPVTIEDTRVVTHEAAPTNSGLIGSSAGSSPDGRVVEHRPEPPLVEHFTTAFIREQFRAFQAGGCRDQTFRGTAPHFVETLLARLATAEAERDRLRAVEAHRAEILNALAYCSHERILDLLDFSGFQLESLTEAEEQRAAFKAAGIALSGLLRAPSTGTTPP